jgi:hypothetical protein
LEIAPFTSAYHETEARGKRLMSDAKEAEVEGDVVTKLLRGSQFEMLPPLMPRALISTHQ